MNEQEHIFKGPAGNIGASIILPQGEGPFPAIVFLHGSGPQARDASRFAAERFAQQGIASLIYDKRGVGLSQGDFNEASFEDLADDAISAAQFIKQNANISAVSFWGHSQGGWLAPLAASRWQHTACVITSAGPAVSPARESEWGFIAPILTQERADSIKANIREIVQAWHRGLRTDNWQTFNHLAAQHSNKDWFARTGLSTLNDHPNASFATRYKRFMDFEPRPVIESLNVPMLAMFASHDESIDSEESLAILREIEKHKKHLQLELYHGFDHSMRAVGDGDNRLRFPNHPETYFEDQAKFILENCQK